MKKRVFAFLIAIVMVISTIPSQAITARAAEPGIGTYAITDSYGSVIISGKVNWYDNDNAAGLRPSSVTVSLYADGTKVMSDTATSPEWEYSFDISDGVPGFDSPVGLTYTIKQEPVSNYQLLSAVHPTVSFQSPSAGSGWTTQNSCSDLHWTNTADGETVVAVNTTAGIIVVWTPEPLAAFEREIIQHSVLSMDNLGAGSVNGFEFLSGQGETDNGIIVNSETISFAGKSLWKKFYIGTYNHGFSTTSENSISNTLLTDIRVSKVWNDANNQDGIRPASVGVHLLKNNAHVGSPVTLNSANNWTAKWSVPLVDENGNTISYHVEEELPAGYSVNITGNADDGFVLTNTHVVDRTNVQTQKVWYDDSDRDGIRPHGVVVQLYRNGQPVTSYTDSTGKTISGTATLTGIGNWAHQWLDLEKNSGGTAITYTVQEVGFVDANGQSVTNPGYTVGYDTDETGRLVVSNTYSPQTINIPVQKVWNDAGNQDGIRPASVTVTLYANGTSTGKSLTLNTSNNWKGAFEGLYVNHAGAPIDYSIVENEVTGYTAAITGTAASGFTVTNTHTPETISVPVNKIWNDAENQDGLRPHEITVALYADGVATGKTLKLNESNNWTGSFPGKVKFKSGAVGTAIVYTVQEVNVPAGYTPSYNGTTVTNTHNPETTNLTVKKVWNDGNNQDGNRPVAVMVTLNINGQTALDGNGQPMTVTLSAANNWTAVWANMPRYQNGTRISYTVVETGYQMANASAQHGIPAGYSATYSYDYTNAIATVTNSYTPETTSLNVQKVWDDDDNREGKRPASVTVTLYQQIGSGTPTVVVDSNGNPITALLSAANEWDADFTGLPKMANQQPILYSVVETPVVGYTTSYSAIDENNVLTITNTHTVNQNVNVTAAKVWNDADNQDAIRPASVTLTLYADGIKTSSTITLDGTVDTNGESEAWKATWSGLYEYYRGKKIVYTVAEETVPGGYSVSVTGSNNSYTVTNTHIPATISVPVTKVWNDADNQDGIRPYGVEITLYRNGVAHQTAKLTAAADATYTFTGLDVHHGIGVPNNYTVAETGYYMTENDFLNASATPGIPTGYASVPSDRQGTVDTGFTFSITNTHTPEQVSLTASKKWDDGNDQDGKRPDKITVALYANDVATGDTIELNTQNNWTASFTGLSKYQVGAVGQLITYSVKEINVPDGYEDTYSGNIITNTHTPETAKLRVQKVWDDANNQDGKRPYAVVITLYQNGSHTTNTLTLKAADNWAGYWDNMPRYHNGQRISYTVVETGYYKTEADFTAGRMTHGIPEGYTPTHHYSEGLATVTNSYTPELTSLNVQKVWEDDNNRDGIRPQSITVTLYQKIGNGAKAVVTDSNGDPVIAVMNPGNEWDITFTGLPKYNQGQEIVYSVAEETVAGYSVSYSEVDPTIRMVTITNTHTVEQVNVTSTKVWDDESNQDGIRPEKVVLTLYANGIRTSATVTLDGNTDTSTAAYRETEAWKATWSGLYKYYHGQEIIYTIVEEIVPAGYTASVEKTAKNAYKVTNSHEVDLISIPVIKTWDDADDQDAIRPSEVQITLYADGTAVKMLTLKASENWMGSFGKLPVNKDGKPIAYTVKEATAPGYTAAYTADDSVDGVLAMQVKNTHIPYKTELTATKIWNDNNDQDGRRPESIVVHILANGEHTGTKITLTADMNWTYTWTNLDKYLAGQEIHYTVYEEPVYFKGISTDGNARAVDTYFASYERNPEDSTEIFITNTYVPETTVITAMKIWDDGDNRDNLRTESVTAQLYADGVTTGKTVVLNEENNWTASWENMPKYKDHGKEIVYSVVENNVPTGYTVTIAQESEYAPGLFLISNTHSPALTSVTVNKIWNDADNNDAIRPHEVTVTLLCNGEKLYTATLSEQTKWTYTWAGLYKNVAGKEAVYTVEETAVDGYTATYIKSADKDGYPVWTITNTHEVKTTELVVTTVWVDDENSQKTRPEEIPAQLYKDGEPYGEVFKITVDKDWQTTIVVPVFDDGKEVAWTVEQIKTPTPYTVTYNQGKLTIINTALFEDSPATGDDFNPTIPISLMAASLAGIITIVLFHRKKKHTDA